MQQPEQPLATDPRIAQNQRMMGQARAAGRDVTDLSTSLMFTSPTMHMGRIAALTAAQSPSSVLDAIANFVRLRGGFASPEERFNVLGDAIRSGASGQPNTERRQVSKLFTNASDFLRSHGGRAGQAAAVAPELLNRYYGAVGKTLWGFDDAAKAALYHRNLERYHDPLIAAYHTQLSLVNYDTPSDFARFLRSSGVANFTTWRTKLPAAVIKAAIERPDVATGMAHASGVLTGEPGAYLGDPVDDGSNERVGRTSLMEGAEPFYDPKGYARGSLTMAGHLGGLALASILGARYPEYWTYGKNPLAYAFYSLPGVAEIAPFSGHGLFATDPLDQLLYTTTGIETRPK
jgi:hypothetical protein